jgi:hypothetical protein
MRGRDRQCGGSAFDRRIRGIASLHQEGVHRDNVAQYGHGLGQGSPPWGRDSGFTLS